MAEHESQSNFPEWIAQGNHLQSVVDKAAEGTLRELAGVALQPDQLALTLMDLSRASSVQSGSFRGDAQIYPASVIKLFYLVAAHQWLEDGKLEDTPELGRAMRDMIVDSGNEATHYLIDLLTGTTSGPELSAEELEQWFHRRNVVNRYFASLGYRRVNANRKPWHEGPYGREMQSVRVHAPNHRNWLTTDETARLLAEIVTGRAVTAERSRQMMELLARDPFSMKAKSGCDDQARSFIGRVLPPGSRLWSKAGWTSEVRHDAACVELPGGKKFVLVVFTTGHSVNREIIPLVARGVMEGVS